MTVGDVVKLFMACDVLKCDHANTIYNVGTQLVAPLNRQVLCSLCASCVILSNHTAHNTHNLHTQVQLGETDKYRDAKPCKVRLKEL